MGKRGPRPTPKAILKARDSWRADIGGDAALAIDPGIPPLPDGIGNEAASVWESVTALASGLGVLTRIDGIALARYCDMFVRWKKVAAWLAKNGEAYPVKNKDGLTVQVNPFPQVAIYANLSVMLVRLEQEFGFTPSARSRITVNATDVKPKEKSRFFPSGPSLKIG